MPNLENALCITLAQYGEQIRFQQGDILWEQNAQSDFAFVVLSGILKFQRQWPGGGHTILGLANRDSIIGEEVFNQTPRISTCTAIVSGKGYRVPHQELSKLLSQKEVALSLLKLSANRLQQTLTRMEELFDGPVEARLASTLLRIGSQIGISDGKGVFIPVRLTRGELAEFIGCRAETTTRLMTKWKKIGLVDTKREGIVIQKIDKLQYIAQSMVSNLPSAK